MRSHDNSEDSNEHVVNAVSNQNLNSPFPTLDEEINAPEGCELDWIINEFNLNQYDEKKKRLLVKL